MIGAVTELTINRFVFDFDGGMLDEQLLETMPYTHLDGFDSRQIDGTGNNNMQRGDIVLAI